MSQERLVDDENFIRSFLNIEKEYEKQKYCDYVLNNNCDISALAKLFL